MVNPKMVMVQTRSAALCPFRNIKRVMKKETTFFDVQRMCNVHFTNHGYESSITAEHFQ